MEINKKLIIFGLFLAISSVSMSAEYDPGGKNPDNDDVIYYLRSEGMQQPVAFAGN